MTVQILYSVELPDPTAEEGETREHTLTLDCILSGEEKDIGWSGSMEDYNLIDCQPPYTGPTEHIEKAIEDHWSEIEEKAFNAREGDE